MSDKPESAVNEIERLRQWGHLEDALTELLQAIPQKDLAAYRTHLFGRKCLLLDWACWAKGVAFDRQRFKELFTLTGASAQLIAPRIHILEAIRVNHSVGRILELLTNAIETYVGFWEYRKQPFVAMAEERSSSHGLEPAFMARLAGRDRGLFRQLAERYGWLHPGLLLAGETWAYVHGRADDWPQEHVVQTWALLEQVDSPDGFAPRLRVERVPGGCGAMYPHPACSGYLTTDDRFQQSLQNAWWAAIGRTPRPWECDFRWSLEFVHHENKLPLDVRATDRSMEVAMACELRAAQAGEQLNEDQVVTAVFANPGTNDMSLECVGPLMRKLVAPQFIDKARSERIRTVVVAATQPEVIPPGTSKAQETVVANGSVTLVPAADFDAAHGRLGRWAKMTQLAKQRIFERAEKILKQECDPYILPPLSREDPEGKLGLDPLGRRNVVRCPTRNWRESPAGICRASGTVCSCKATVGWANRCCWCTASSRSLKASD